MAFKTLPTGGKVTWILLLAIMAYTALQGLYAVIYFSTHTVTNGMSSSWYGLLLTLIEASVGIGSVVSIFRFRAAGMKWLWAYLIYTTVYVLLSFVGVGATGALIGLGLGAVNVIFALLMIGGYREILKQQKKVATTAPQIK